jgi:hypothetical protein
LTVINISYILILFKNIRRNELENEPVSASSEINHTRALRLSDMAAVKVPKWWNRHSWPEEPLAPEEATRRFTSSSRKALAEAMVAGVCPKDLDYARTAFEAIALILAMYTGGQANEGITRSRLAMKEALMRRRFTTSPQETPLPLTDTAIPSDGIAISPSSTSLGSLVTVSLDRIESGLRIYEGPTEFRPEPDEAGRAYILGLDVQDRLVAIYVETDDANDGSFGRIGRYMGRLRREVPNVPGVRGILIAKGFPDNAKDALAAIPDLALKRWVMRIDFVDA